MLALVLTAIAAVGSAPRANAAFTTAVCDGADITGRGASFARDAHNVFINNFEPVFCGGVPSPTITYEALGSGAGRLAVKVRNDVPRFGMSDEPPTPAEIAQMDAGTGNEPAENDANPNDNGLIHVVPAAVGAVPPLVNFPDNCDVSLLPEASRTAEQNNDADGTPDDVMRVRFTKQQFEEVWEKDPAADAWHEVFPALAPDADCQKPIIRVVRFDDSGTSFTFKDYLNSIDGAEGWLTTYVAGANKTREWPSAVFGARADCGGANGPGAQEDAIDQLTSGCANGNGPLVAKLVATDGSVGYSDVSTARSNSPSLAITPEGNDNDTYWTQVQNGSGTFTEPTSSANGFRTDGPKGANCSTTTFTGIPDAEDGTLGDWSKASGVNSPAGFGICTLTYGLVFDDNADVWGGSAAEEAKARTVLDYWENVLSTPAQAALFPNDYAPLPAAILKMSRAGIAEVDWEKGESNPGPGPGPGDPNPGGNPPAGNAPPPLSAPSNLFSLPRKTISSKTGQATISVKIPGPGVVEMIGTANVPSGKAGRQSKKSIRVGRTVLNASKAGTFNLTLKPGGAAKRRLQKTGSLRVSLTVTYTPTGGTAKTTNISVTLKLAASSSGRRR
ncbi:MAG TPA: substrate-binding domain-containing protein [Solirubrobacterales bacterium]